MYSTGGVNVGFIIGYVGFVSGPHSQGKSKFDIPKKPGLTVMWVTCSCSTGDVNVGFIIGDVDLCQGHTAKEKVSLIFLKSQGLTVIWVSCSTGDINVGFISVGTIIDYNR